MRSQSLRRAIPAFLIVLAGMADVGAAPIEFDFAPSPLEAILKEQARRVTLQTIPRAEAAPVIDGALDDAAWRDAPVVEIVPAGEAAGATAKIFFTKDSLCIGVRCGFDPARPPAPKTRRRDGRDGECYKDDCVEIWLSVGREKLRRRYQFVVNSDAAVYDALDDNVAYNPEWPVTVRLGDNAWTAEIALPRDVLGLDSWPGRMPFNIGRNSPTMTPRAWKGDYGDVSLGALAFEGVTAAVGTAEAEGSIGGVGALQADFMLRKARPGERWIEGGLTLDPGKGGVEGTTLIAELYDVATGRRVAHVRAQPSRDRGRILIDLRDAGISRARLRLEYCRGEQALDATEVFLAADPPARALVPGERIAVPIDMPENVSQPKLWPVTFGVPFPAGALWDANAVRLVDAGGRELPSQREALATWHREGSIKWLRFDALVTPGRGLFVEVAAPTADSTPTAAVSVREHGDAIVVETARARYTLGKGASPVREVALNGRRTAWSDGARGLYVVDQNGRVGRAVAEEETAVIEARGPVAACVRFEGWYAAPDGARMARHITRVECFAGQPFANVTHTLVITEDTNKVWFKEIGWELAVDPGAGPRGVFNTSRDDWRKSLAVPLVNAVPAATMFQDSHYYFAQHENHFSVLALPSGRKAEKRFEGKEMGDWAMLAGASGGLGVACEESARQHPKEFEFRPDRVILRLFSNRGGEEIDFRAKTLVKKWDYANWYKKDVRKVYWRNQEKKVARIESNGVGWAKTHSLLLMPVSSAGEEPAVARAAKLRRDEIFALADPHWIYATRAMGPNHPRDDKQYPEVEKFIEWAFDYWNSRVPAFGHYGFMDYYGGPTIGYKGKYPTLKRYLYTYSLRHDVWYYYARTGMRKARRFAQGTNRAYLDNYMCHWGASDRVKGLYRIGSGGDSLYGDTMSGLPFYWGARSDFNVTSSTDLNQFRYDYYLTGYRRARDMMLEFADGVKQAWSPERVKREWRIFMMLRALIQTYTSTWDSTIRAMAEATADVLIDEEGALWVTKEKPFASSYKTQTDIVVMQEAWQVFGDPRFRETLSRLSRFWWGNHLGGKPINYGNPDGFAGYFLYNETGDPSVVEEFLNKMRRMVTHQGRGSGEDRHVAVSNLRFILQGIGYAMDVIRRAGGPAGQYASWAGCEDFGFPVSFCVKKGKDESVRLDYLGPSSTEVRGVVTVRQVDKKSNWGLDLITMKERTQGPARVVIPKDAPGGLYEVKPTQEGGHFILCDSRAPLVVYAPEYWRPSPEQSPSAQVYFTLPKDSKDAQVFFETETRLFTPDGKPFGGGKSVRGWVDLPADRPGLWSFRQEAPGVVRVRNAPPFFAMDDPEAWFDPGIAWKREAAPPAAEAISKETVYVPGAVQTEGNRAIYFAGRRQLTIQGGSPHPSGDGRMFLPHKEGTIEFWFKPNWSTFELKSPYWQRLFWSPTEEKGAYWELAYIMQPRYANWFFKQSLYAYFQADSPTQRHMSSKTYRRTLFERGEWTHIAWVWANVMGLDNRDRGRHTIVSTLYVNGKKGKSRICAYIGGYPEFAPARLILGHDVRAAIDELRISDVPRYSADFTPPNREQEFTVDENTRALFHFNGDVKGLSYGRDAPVPVSLRK